MIAAEILAGLTNYTFRTKEIEQLAYERSEICSVCEHRKVNRCGKCGCFVVLKVRSPKSKCPDKRWKR